MFIEVGNQVVVEDLIRGMIAQSGNDACVALAERIAGTEAAFVDMMNAQAETLKMDNTRFQNSHGLPSKQLQFSSALDIAIVTKALIRNFRSITGIIRNSLLPITTLPSPIGTFCCGGMNPWTASKRAGQSKLATTWSVPPNEMKCG